MARLCERPGCSVAAAVGYGFDARRHLVFLSVLYSQEGTAIRGGALCEHHADSLTPPLGWWLDDLRESQPRLFRQQPPPEHPVAKPRPRHQRPASRQHVDSTEELPFEIMATDALPTAGLDQPAGDRAGGPAVALPWIPVFDRRDDLNGLLSARTPLLAKAFGTEPFVDGRPQASSE